MATITKREYDHGISYKITVSSGRDINNKQIRHHMTWTPPPKMTEKQIEKELKRQAVLFEEKIKLKQVGSDRQIFADYSDYVIKLKERTGIKHTTILRYKSLKERLLPLIGHLAIGDIRPQHLNDAYAKLGEEGQNKITGEKLSSKTIIEHHRFVSTVLNQAKKDMILLYNPAESATPPHYKQKQPNFFQPETVTEILNCLNGEPIKWKMATLLLIHTGCRRGEVLGLKWSAIDFDNGKIKIESNSLYTADKGIYNDTLKTDRSYRTLKVPDNIMDLIKQYRVWYLEQRLLNGDRWVNTDYLFIKDNGEPMHPDSLTDWLAKFSERHNLPHINPHAFRHTHASVLIHNKIDIKTVSDRMGHAKVATTLNFYAQPIDDADDEASKSFANSVNEKKA